MGLAPEPHSGFERGWLPVWDGPANWPFNPGGGGIVEACAVVPPAPSVEVAELLTRWVRRSAIGGDARRGSVRLELDRGRFAGAELVVSAEGSSVAVDLRLPEAPGNDALAERVRRRLSQRGYDAEVVITARG